MVFEIQLNKTSYAPGEVISGTILYNDTPTRAKYYVNPEYDVMYSFAYDTTGNIAVGVNQQGEREILGFDVGMSEDGAFWEEFLRRLVARV